MSTILTLVVDINEKGEIGSTTTYETQEKDEIQTRLAEMVPPRKGYRRIAYTDLVPTQADESGKITATRYVRVNGEFKVRVPTAEEAEAFLKLGSKYIGAYGLDYATVVGVFRELEDNELSYVLRWAMAGKIAPYTVRDLERYTPEEQEGILFRPNREDLEASLFGARVFKDEAELEEFIRFKKKNKDYKMTIKPHRGIDFRCGWNTGLVLWGEELVGYVHLKEKKA